MSEQNSQIAVINSFDKQTKKNLPISTFILILEKNVKMLL